MNKLRLRRFTRRFTGQRLITLSVFIISGVISFGFLFTVIIFAWFARDLPSPGKLTQLSQSSTIFLDRDDKLLFEMYKDKNRYPVAFDEISDNLKEATLAIEDKNFYRHRGISELGIIRAAINITLPTKKLSC